MTEAPPSPASAGATASVRLRRKIALAIGPFSAACTALVEHPRLSELWPKYLVLQHEIIRATVPLTEAALARARSLDGDKLSGPLAEYLEEHVDEERDHDVSLLDDLEALGVERAAVLDRMPSPAVAALVGAQYYWLFHYHPVTFLGFVAFMEGFPPTPELVATLMERTGHPAEAFRTFAEHAELDPQHRAHLDETLDSLPLTRQHETVLAVSATATAALAARALEETLER